MPQDRVLQHLFPAFDQRISQILQELATYANQHMPGVRWVMTEGFRTAQYQRELFQKGRTIPPIGRGYCVTFCDGFRKRSCHQSSLAVDIWPIQGSAIAKVAPDHWVYLGHLARQHGLEWGGDWEQIVDVSHVQWPEADRSTYAIARKWQVQVGLR